MRIVLYTIITILLTLSCTFIAGCSAQNNGENNNTTGSSTDKNSDTEVLATEITTTNPNEETTATLPDGMAYQLEDGSFISIDELITPMNKLNMICQGISETASFSGIYPDDIANKLAKFNKAENPEQYADFLHHSYMQIYGTDFSVKNEYLSCTPLSYEEIEDMKEFYNNYFSTEISPEYAFIVESTFTVTYKDEEGNEAKDSSSDFYIAYCINDIFYIDYFFADTLDL